MKKNDNNIRQKLKNIKFDKKRLVISGIYIFLSLCFFTAYGWIPAEYKYTRQFMAFFGFAFLIIFLISLKKLFTPEIRAELYRMIGQGILGFVSKISIIKNKIKKTLGIKDKKLLYSEDEKRIIINDPAKQRRKTGKPLTQKKFSSLTDDKERLRFIYAKFIISERKNGRSCNPYHTPEELRLKTETGEKEDRLFNLYTPVRYARDITPTREQIKEQYEYFAHKIKIK